MNQKHSDFLSAADFIDKGQSIRPKQFCVQLITTPPSLYLQDLRSPTTLSILRHVSNEASQQKLLQGQHWENEVKAMRAAGIRPVGKKTWGKRPRCVQKNWWGAEILEATVYAKNHSNGAHKSILQQSSGKPLWYW